MSSSLIFSRPTQNYTKPPTYANFTQTATKKLAMKLSSFALMSRWFSGRKKSKIAQLALLIK